MTERRESKILQIIKSNRDWRNYFKENYPEDIVIIEEGNFAIFNYRGLSNFCDPIVKEARGIIIDTFNCEVVCFPFTKFGKYDDYYADTIDWSTAKVQEKIDGSIIKMWFNKYTGDWQFSTNSVIDAKNAPTASGISYYDVITSTEEYKIINKNIKAFNKDTTYIFELVSEYNRVVIKYNKNKLYLIGIRNNISGEEYEPNMLSLPKPLTYPLSSLDECLNYVNNIMNNVNGNLICDNEGFVVVDDNWNRIKIKSPIYMILHCISDITKKNKIRLCNFIYNGSLDTRELSKDFSSTIHILKFYEYHVSEYLYNVSTIIDISRKLYKMTNDRKKVASIISKHKYSNFGFTAITNPEMTVDEILERCAYNYDSVGAYIAKFIPDYESLPDNKEVWENFNS